MVRFWMFQMRMVQFWMLWYWIVRFGWHSFGCYDFGCCGFECCKFGCCEYFLRRRLWMFFGGYERWMLRFWTLRKLDATVLDALIATRIGVLRQRQFVAGCGRGWWRRDAVLGGRWWEAASLTHCGLNIGLRDEPVTGGLHFCVAVRWCRGRLDVSRDNAGTGASSPIAARERQHDVQRGGVAPGGCSFGRYVYTEQSTPRVFLSAKAHALLLMWIPTQQQSRV